MVKSPCQKHQCSPQPLQGGHVGNNYLRAFLARPPPFYTRPAHLMSHLTIETQDWIWYSCHLREQSPQPCGKMASFPPPPTAISRSPLTWNFDTFYPLPKWLFVKHSCCKCFLLRVWGETSHSPERGIRYAIWGGNSILCSCLYYTLCWNDEVGSATQCRNDAAGSNTQCRNNATGWTTQCQNDAAGSTTQCRNAAVPTTKLLRPHNTGTIKLARQ